MSTSEELQSGEYEAHDGGFKPLTPEDVVEIEKEYGASLGPNFLTNSPQEQKKILGLMEQLHGKNGKWTEYLADSKVLLAKAEESQGAACQALYEIAGLSPEEAKILEETDNFSSGIAGITN